MAEIKRSSDIVEGHAEQALAAGLGGLVAVVIAVILGRIGGGFIFLAWVLGVIGTIALLYAAYRLILLRGVKSFTLVCPYCRAKNGFVEQPMTDVDCRECHRMIPIENGRVMPIAEIRCLSCGETAYYSGRTKVLLCEGCGKEIAVAAEAIAALRTSG